jgi:hypothetical protein
MLVDVSDNDDPQLSRLRSVASQDDSSANVRGQRRRAVARTAAFLRDLFTPTPPPEPGEDEPPYAGGLGVREPRRPVMPSSSGSVALEPSPAETRDVWAVGEDDERD